MLCIKCKSFALIRCKSFALIRNSWIWKLIVLLTVLQDFRLHRLLFTASQKSKISWYCPCYIAVYCTVAVYCTWICDSSAMASMGSKDLKVSPGTARLWRFSTDCLGLTSWLHIKNVRRLLHQKLYIQYTAVYETNLWLLTKSNS